MCIIPLTLPSCDVRCGVIPIVKGGPKCGESVFKWASSFGSQAHAMLNCLSTHVCMYPLSRCVKIVQLTSHQHKISGEGNIPLIHLLLITTRAIMAKHTSQAQFAYQVRGVHSFNSTIYLLDQKESKVREYANGEYPNPSRLLCPYPILLHVPYPTPLPSQLLQPLNLPLQPPLLLALQTRHDLAERIAQILEPILGGLSPYTLVQFCSGSVFDRWKGR